MDAAIIYNRHYKYGNKHVCWKKIVNALGKVEIAEDATDKQKRVLEELQHTEHHNWTIQAKRHSYTDGVNPIVSTEGFIVVVQKPLLRMAREIFALVSIQFPECLVGQMTILPTGNGDVYGYEGYTAMIARNIDCHNTKDFITIDGYHPDHRELVVSFKTLTAQPVLQGIDVVYDVIETNQSQAKGKYFVFCDRGKRQEAERMIHEVLKAITFRITDICNTAAEKQYKQCPSLRSRLSQGGYTMQAAELHKEIYNHKTLPKSYTSKPYLDMSGFTLGNDDLLTPPAAAALT